MNGRELVTIAGPYTGRPADERLACYPVEAVCGCGEMARCERQGAEWVHTGRKAGEQA